MEHEQNRHEDIFRVSGYPASQIVISGLIASVSAIPIVLLWASGRPIHISVFIATAGMLAISMLAVFAKPFVIVSVDPDKEKLTVQWKSFCGIISRSRKLWVKDIRKLVYGVTTLHSKYRNTHSYSSRSSFYADMANGSHEYLSPRSQATSGLSKKLGMAISEYLEIPFVRRSGGSGHFKEEPIH